MDKESIYLLQNLDCNCNDCKFMHRDMVEYNLWKGYTEHLQYVIFLRARMQVFKTAGYHFGKGNIKTAKQFDDKARKMKFQFDTAELTTSYGICLNRKGKWNQPVTFIPNTIQLDTQHCFVHRRSETTP